MGNKLYVGNLPFDTTERDLHELFGEVGTVREAAIIQDKMTGNSRGFAFVTMGSDEEASAAAEKFNGQQFQGRSLTVNEARPREEFGGGGGGGGGGYKKKSYGGGGGGGGGDRGGYRGGGGGGGGRRY